ncbi:MAG TPA: PfkB family carbohydrate kinase [Gaiellaceae bacterium]|jgi:phosphomannomutase/sugar/nucleoside kinase (ribokinase family)|nr:PfkB family carbohydrate kinase [Gaiellaceae bacterium]
MTAPVVVVGALNVDVLGRVAAFPGRDESAELGELRVAPGGHAGNCAVALSRLGVPSRIAACVGADPLADVALRELQALGVDTGYVERTEASPTGVVFVPVLPDGDKALYLGRGANESLSAATLTSAAAGACRLVVFDPPRALLGAVAELARSTLCVFAPGGVLATLPVELFAPLLEAADGLVLNEPEARAMAGAGGGEAAIALARRWRLWAFVTAGSDGCCFAGPQGELDHAPSIEVTTTDATGAGDAFVAGLVSALVEDLPIRTAVERGCVVGALATRGLGAQASLPDRAELERIAACPDREPVLRRGADGWRGLIGAGFTLESVGALVDAVAAELGTRDGRGVLVTCDGRRRSAEAASRAAATLAGKGLAPTLVPELPTPVAAAALANGELRAAVLVTASHNPADWNGVKLKLAPGTPPSREFEEAVERRRARSRGASPDGSYAAPDAARRERLLDAFVARNLAAADVAAIRKGKPRVVVDGLHGIAGGLLARILADAGAEPIVVRAEPDPDFAGLVPDPMHVPARRRAQEALRQEAAEAAFLVDGDGDRLGVLDGTGAFVHPHDLLALLVPLARERDSAGRAVATTVSVGSVVRRAAERLGCRVVETPVGFKHMAPLLLDGTAFLAGGAVGDVGVRANGCDRNPYLAALLLLELSARRGLSVGELREELVEELGATSYLEETQPLDGRVDLEAAARRALAAAGLGEPREVVRVEGVKLYLSPAEWLLVRPATTEPGLRAHVEMREPEAAQAVLGALREQLKGDDGS